MALEKDSPGLYKWQEDFKKIYSSKVKKKIIYNYTCSKVNDLRKMREGNPVVRPSDFCKGLGKSEVRVLEAGRSLKSRKLRDMVRSSWSSWSSLSISLSSSNTILLDSAKEYFLQLAQPIKFISKIAALNWFFLFRRFFTSHYIVDMDSTFKYQFLLLPWGIFFSSFCIFNFLFYFSVDF